MRTIIKEGVLLIGEKKHPSFIEEFLKSYLSPSQRNIDMLTSSNIKTNKAA